MDDVINSHVYYSIEWGGKTVPFITDAVVNMWIAMAAIMLTVYFLTRKLKQIPIGGQRSAEMMVEFFNNLAQNQIGHNWKPFVSYLGTMLIFIIACNVIAIFNVIPTGGLLSRLFHAPDLAAFDLELHPPTKNFNVTLCLGLISILVVICTEFRYKGVKGWLRSFYKPTPISAFIKLLDYVVRPLSLCLRLFGNILGGLIVMTLLYSAMPFFVPAVVGVYFDLFDGILQAYVFVFLTSIYIGEAAEVEASE